VFGVVRMAKSSENT